MKLPIISFLTSALLVLSVVYDFTYLSALNLSFSQIPTTISDHVRSALLWAPLLFLGLFSYFFFEMVLKRAEKGMSEEEIINTSPNPKFTRRFRKSPRYGIAFVAIIILIGYFLGVDYTLSDLRLSLTILWFIIFQWIFAHERILAKFPRELPVILLVFGGILLYVLFQGAIDAKRALANPEINAYFELKDKRLIEKKLLRNFENFSLIYDNSTKNIEVLLKSEVVYFGFEAHKKNETNDKENKQ